MTTARANLEVRATEAQCEDTIIRAARTLGWLAHAERKAMTNGRFRTPIKGDAGWPDLVLARSPHLWFVELKRHPHPIDAAQTVWLSELRRHCTEAFVLWVPEQMHPFLQVLANPSTLHQFMTADHPRTPAQARRTTPR